MVSQQFQPRVQQEECDGGGVKFKFSLLTLIHKTYINTIITGTEKRSLHTCYNDIYIGIVCGGQIKGAKLSGWPAIATVQLL